MSKTKFRIVISTLQTTDIPILARFCEIDNTIVTAIAYNFKI